MLPDTTLWPYNPSAKRASMVIDWFTADAKAFLEVSPSTLNSCPRAALVNLMQDLRLESRRKSMLLESQEALRSIVETGKLPVVPKRKASSDKEDRKDELESMTRGIIDAAAAQDNVTGQLHGVKLLAELRALLNDKEKVDPVITIIVETGVPRE